MIRLAITTCRLPADQCDNEYANCIVTLQDSCFLEMNNDCIESKLITHVES